MSNTLTFFPDTPQTCPYLADQQAQNIYPDPKLRMNNALYSQLIQYGFRRSGNHIYKPHCASCNACIPVRIKLSEFKANRSQRRCLQRNAHLDISFHPARFNQEHFQLYCQYIGARHPGQSH